MISLATFTQFGVLFVKGLGLTVGIGFTALVIGFFLGMLLAIFTNKRIAWPCISWVIAFYVVIVRGTPVYVQLLLVYYALPDLLGINLSPLLAGIITLSVNSAAYMTEIMRSGINTVSSGQWEAGYVLGYSSWAIFWYIILPQALRNSLPEITNESVVLIKETSILSVLGITEVTKVAIMLNARYLKPIEFYCMAALVYLLITSCVSGLAYFLENRMNHDTHH